MECRVCKKLEPLCGFVAWKNAKGEKRFCKICIDCSRIRFRRQTLRKKYGITLEDYDRMLKEQGGKCALCGRIGSGRKSDRGNLLVDHDHQTKKNRGLLCYLCNRALAAWGDNVVGIKRVLEYVERGTYNGHDEARQRLGS